MIILIFLIALFISLALIFITLSLLSRVKNASVNDYYNERGRFLRQLIKGSWYEQSEKYLKEAGNPLSTEFFLLVHILVMVVGLYTILEGLVTGELSSSITNLARLILFTLVPLHLIINRRIRHRQNLIRLELCNIQDVLYFQTKIGTPDDVTLTYAARVAKAPIREPLQYIANAPKVKKSYEEALEHFRGISKITEIQAFSFALAQKQEMGITEKSFKAQSNLLKRNKRIRRRIIRQYKRTKLLMAAVLLFICYILMVSVPLVQEVLASLDVIFR